MADGSHSFAFPASQQFTYSEPGAYVAQRLRHAHRILRYRVDGIDLKEMGVEGVKADRLVSRKLFPEPGVVDNAHTNICLELVGHVGAISYKATGHLSHLHKIGRSEFERNHFEYALLDMQCVGDRVGPDSRTHRPERSARSYEPGQLRAKFIRKCVIPVEDALRCRKHLSFCFSHSEIEIVSIQNAMFCKIQCPSSIHRPGNTANASRKVADLIDYKSTKDASCLVSQNNGFSVLLLSSIRSTLCDLSRSARGLPSQHGNDNCNNPDSGADQSSPRSPINCALLTQRPAANEHPFQRFHATPYSRR